MPSAIDQISTAAGIEAVALDGEGDAEAEGGTENAPYRREDDGLGEHLPDDVAPPRAERLPEADLSRALGGRPST